MTTPGAGAQEPAGPVHFAGQLTEADYLRANALATRNVVFGFTALLAAIVAVQASNWSWATLAAQPVYSMFMFAPLLLVMPISLALRPVVLRRRWRRNPTLGEPVQGEVSEQGIVWSVEGSSYTLPWQRFLHYRQSPSLFLVYVTRNRYLYFFEPYFSGPAEWQRFRALVASRLPRKRNV